MNIAFVIRPETEKDYPSIHMVVQRAFRKEGENVAELVELIRKSPNYIPELSLVAEFEGTVVGHGMLSHLNLQDNGKLHQIVTLSPLSVLPEMQKKGIGSALVKTAIEKADKLGEPLIVLEGSPNYYPRFGFKFAGDFGVTMDLPSWAAKEAAMVYPLSKYKPEIKGEVVYPPAFDKVNESAHNRTER